MKNNYKLGICSGCTNEALIVHKSKKLCYRCLQSLRVRKMAEKKKQRVEKGEIVNPDQLSVFYQSYWNRNTVRFCYECGIELKKYYRWHIHHVIPKRKWKEYDIDIVFNDNNCVYVCLDCHSRAETNLQTAPKLRELSEIKQREFEPFRRGSR